MAFALDGTACLTTRSLLQRALQRIDTAAQVLSTNAAAPEFAEFDVAVWLH